MSKIGRPTIYDQNLVDVICNRISEGESMRSICRDDSMPRMTTMFRWLREKEDFRKQYELAREWQADTFADELSDIADDGSNDWMEKRDKEGNFIGWQVNGEAIQRSRLRCDVRKWTASKLKPKKYGERLQHANDEENPMPTMILYCPKEEKDDGTN